MKKLFLIALLVAALAAVFTTSAFAAGPTTPPCQADPAAGFTYGAGAAQNTNARNGAPEWAGNNETAAGLTGLTVEELQAERLAGKSLAQIAAGSGLDEDALIASLLEARQAKVAQLLADGKISQAQADYMLSHMAERVQTMAERTNVGPAPFRGQSPEAGTRQGQGPAADSGQGQGRWNR